ncbi:MAG: STAS domain-containing protein [Bacteroidetes bacterium]|nr:STAS domain-containing protein [Bacteroidota bacterium]MCH8522988.1 STAS domain-containing protein [Balneolales bacterium]
MKYDISRIESATRLTINSDKLDSKLAPELKSLFINLISDQHSGDLIVNLNSVSFADSSGLSALLLASRLYRDASRKLVLFNLSDRISKLIAISQLSSVFMLAENEDEALSLLK